MNIRAILVFGLVTLFLTFAKAQGSAPLAPQALISKLKWRCVGPYIGGRVVTVTGVPGNKNLFYAGTVGGGRIHCKENDTGPDGANHNWDGIFVMAEGRDLGRSGQVSSVEGLRLYDVAPTILEAFKMAPLPQMQGKAIGSALAQAV